MSLTQKIIVAGLSAALVLFLFVAVGGFLSNKKTVVTADSNQDVSGVIEGVAGMKLGGSFTLVRHDGKIVTDQNYTNAARLVFFGFTYCPDICPTELSMITRLLEQMSKTERDKIHVLFVSVDPERDTPEQMRHYVSLFHEKIEGLTGTKQQIDQIKKAYKVYAQKVLIKNSDDYTIDHSAFVYFFDENNILQAMFRAGTDETIVLPIVRKYL